MADGKDTAALDLVGKVLALGIEGKAPGMKSSVELAEDYASDDRFQGDDERIDSLIRWQVASTATSGFVTGLGGMVTMPVTVPAGLIASWVVQARLVGAIAHLRRYDLEDERVRTVALAAIVGDATVTEATKRMGGQIATKSAQAAVNRVPGRVLIDINKKIGFRLITRAGSTGVINLTKIVPIVGGVVGGTVDAAATRTVGAVAKRAFPAGRPLLDAAA